MKNKRNELISVHFDYTPNGKVQVQIDVHDLNKTFVYDKPIEMTDEESLSDAFNHIGEVLWDSVNNTEPDIFEKYK